MQLRRVFTLIVLMALWIGAAAGAAEPPPPIPTTLDQFLAGLNASSGDGSAPFTADAFAEAQRSDAIIVIHVNAFWCSTCGAQRDALSDVLADLRNDPAFAKPAIFQVDFDQQKDIVRQLGVREQGTLIIFRGATEIGRSVGTTDAAAIRALLRRAEAPAGAPPGPGTFWSAGSYLLALLAGILSSLSPCVLPLLPIVIGGAATTHRFGAAALGSGFALSFFALGIFVEAIGFGLGLDHDTVRIIAAWAMIGFGVVLLSAFLQQRLATAGAGIERAADRLMSRTQPLGLRGQFIAGVLLGAMWSPCIGPTLGAALGLAGERNSLIAASLVVALFGIGVALPLVAVGLMSRRVLLRWYRPIEIADHVAKSIFGGVLIVIGVATLLGADRALEALALRIAPAWLIRLPTIL